MAMRDQIIHNQQDVQRNMWNLLLGLGLDKKRISEIAAKQGILIEDWTTTSCPGSSDNKQSQNVGCGSTYIPLLYSPCSGQSVGNSSRIFQNNEDITSGSVLKGNWNLPRTFCREEHHSSYYYTTHDSYPSPLMRPRKRNEHGLDDRGACSGFDLPGIYPHSFQELYQKNMRALTSPYNETTPMQASSCSSDFQQQQKVCLQTFYL